MRPLRHPDPRRPAPAAAAALAGAGLDAALDQLGRERGEVRAGEWRRGDRPDIALVAACLHAAHPPAGAARPLTIPWSLCPVLRAFRKLGVAIGLPHRVGVVEVISPAPQIDPPPG